MKPIFKKIEKYSGDVYHEYMFFEKSHYENYKFIGVCFLRNRLKGHNPIISEYNLTIYDNGNEDLDDETLNDKNLEDSYIDTYEIHKNSDVFDKDVIVLDFNKWGTDFVEHLKLHIRKLKIEAVI